jgi:flavin reductase (DIM6/NTAB) family NADH-FMN oxidoreductase RutF
VTGESASPAAVSELLRHLTLPIVAITTTCEGRTNGYIANSAQRASLLPTGPRLSVYCLKTNFSHDLILRSGWLAVHLLHDDQWEVISRLGLSSGRSADKLHGLTVPEASATCPVLAGCRAVFECRVVNTMDAGPVTFLLADVVQTIVEPERGGIMTSSHFRDHAPPVLKQKYEENLRAAQQYLASVSSAVDPDNRWTGPTARP